MLNIKNFYRLFGFSVLALILGGCSTGVAIYKAYLGDPLKDMQLALVEGARFQRMEYINRYTDAVRFMTVDEIPIGNSDQFEAIQIAPGFHELKVYFSWDMGNQRGLAPAMVDFARTRDHISRTLRFNARAGERYIVQAEPIFNAPKHNITTLAYVDFWVENAAGDEIVSREEGRYISAQ